jgi:hypothetical protein
MLGGNEGSCMYGGNGADIRFSPRVPGTAGQCTLLTLFPLIRYGTAANLTGGLKSCLKSGTMTC